MVWGLEEVRIVVWEECAVVLSVLQPDLVDGGNLNRQANFNKDDIHKQ